MNARMLTLALVLPLALPAAAFAADDDEGRAPTDVPADLVVSADEKLSFVALGVGVQIYDCRAADAGYAWVFRAPEATLYSPDGDVIGTHYAGPTWESNSGGTVVATVAKRVPAPDPATAIPWLRLTATAHDGPGLFSKVTTIQRLFTVGGVAPAGGCDASTAGAEARVPYQTYYYFYKAHDGSN